MTLTMRSLICLGILLAMFGCGKAPPAPKSEKEFINAYRSAYDNGENAALFSLVKWDGVPDDIRNQLQKALTLWIGTQKVSSIEMIKYEPDPNIAMEVNGRKLKYNLEPRYWLVVKHEGSESSKGLSSYSRFKFPIGVENGVFKLCGAQWDEP